MMGWIEALAHAFNSQELCDVDEGIEHIVWMTLHFIIHWYWNFHSCVIFPLSLKSMG